MAETCLVTSGHKARPGGTAYRCAHIPAGKTNAVFRDGVDVGRRDIGASLNAQVGIAEVVCQHDEDVRTSWLRSGLDW